MVVRRPSFDTLDREKTTYFLASGGRDSTAFVLEAHRLGIKGELVYGDTRLNRSDAIKVLKRLAKYTGYKLNIVRYEGTEKPIRILKQSFKNLPKAIAFKKKTGVFRRNMFSCCSTLKHKPMDAFFSQLDKDSIQLVIGMKAGDGALHRRYRLRQLREKETFYRTLKANGLTYFYPLRDCFGSDIDLILSEYGFDGIHGSGCTICPIFLMFEGIKKKDPATYRRSLQFAKSLNIEIDATLQTDLREHCIDRETDEIMAIEKELA